MTEESDMRATLLIVGFVSFVGFGLMPQARAEDLARFVEGALLHRSDALRYEQEAHRNNRPDEEHYWHRYGEGLERQGDHR
jgi:hypothetical protein